MLHKILPAIFFLLIPAIACAQLNHYQSADNKYYWKNKMPHAAYWQQDVAYKIDAKLDEETHRIIGKQTLHYVNNSPDTLHFVFFHLFQNAFINASYLRQLEKINGARVVLGPYEAEGKGIEVEKLIVDGVAAKVELDNTILKVFLPKPLPPHGHTVFNIDFTSYYDNKGTTRRRMKMYDAWGFMHYNGCQWFPKLSVYDQRNGWDTYQHLGKEFYGDFGVYDVTLDLPSNYVVEATGSLQNRAEVLPDTLRKRLDMKNFAQKKWNEAPSIITPYKKGERKKWHFYAENVHDFAFTADPSYRIATTYWKGIECVGIAQEPHAAGWQNSANLVAKIIETFSTKIGHYAYPKMVAADAADGMEYPMLTLDGGAEPGYRGLLVHEIGHNWFYGMVGNNETYRAFMDEGFTQYLTALGLENIDGKYGKGSPPKKFLKRQAYRPISMRDARVFRGYYQAAVYGKELPIQTHSDDFDGALGHGGGYSQVYYKAATMLYNLQLVLGDSLFDAAFSHYFHQWKMAHPYPEDFKNSITQFVGMDLSWFFDQWMETTKTIDYGIDYIRKAKGENQYAIGLRRIGKMQMPLDFTVTDKKGQKQSYYIPNNFIEKNTEAIRLNRWTGWGKVNPTHEVIISQPNGIKHIEIDTSNRLADIYPLNNYKTKGLPISPKAIRAKWHFGIKQTNSLRQYDLYLRPDLWWNPIDGVKVGLNISGDYLKKWHRIAATFWWNTHFLQHDSFQVVTNESLYSRYVPFNYSFQYASPVSRDLLDLEMHLSSRWLEGLWKHSAGLAWQINNMHSVNLTGTTMWRPLNFDLDYLHRPMDWSSRQALPNSFIELTHRNHLQHKWGHSYGRHTLRAPFFTGDNNLSFNYSFVEAEHRDYLTFGKIDVRTRLYGRYGMGHNIPSESALYTAGANPEEAMENKYTRTKFTVEAPHYNISETETGHYQYGGGLNLRGYNGYLIADERNGEILMGYKSRSGFSANVEVDFDRLISFQPKPLRNWLRADVYAFADAGAVELNHIPTTKNYRQIQPSGEMSSIRVDAGLGLAFTIKKFGAFNEAEPLTLRVDFPLFLNKPPFANPDYFKFRWLIGVSRSF